MYNPELEGYGAWLTCRVSALAQTYNAASICPCVEQCIKSFMSSKLS